MEVNAIRNDSANISAKVRISKKTIDEKMNKIVKEQAKNMSVAGFRKGKVPASVAKSRLGEELQKMVNQDLMSKAYKTMLEDLEIDVEQIVGEPRIPKYEEIDGGLDVEIACDLRPTVILEGYKELIPKITKPEVTDEEIATRVDSLLKSVAKEKKVKDRDILEDKDIALIDFEGFMDGKAFEGGKGEAYSLEIGSGSFIPGFEEQLIGMKIEEEKEINLTFPTEYGSKDLAGKDTMFKVKLLEISAKVVPTEINEEIAKKLMPNREGGDMDALKEDVTQQIGNEKLSQLLQNEIKPKYVDTLIENYNFDIPQGIVDQEINLALQNYLRTLNEDEIKEYSAKDKVEAKKEELSAEAQNSVKLTFLVDELARDNEVTADDNEVKQAIMYEAYQNGQDPTESLKRYEENNMLPAVKMAIIEQKLFDQLFRETLKA